jgi:hypothetical protein
MFFTGDDDAVAQGLAHARQDKLIGFAECGDRAGLRTHHADFDDARRRPRGLKHPR